jgi:hypothetical protein
MAATWLLVLTDLAAAAAPRLLIVGAHVLWLGLLVIGLAAQALLQMGVDTNAQPLLTRALPGLALMGLILLQQIYRSSTQSARRALRYFVIGVGGMFLYDLILFFQMELASGISGHVWNARGFVNSLAVPMIALVQQPAVVAHISSRQAVFMRRPWRPSPLSGRDDATLSGISAAPGETLGRSCSLSAPLAPRRSVTSRTATTGGGFHQRNLQQQA